MLDQGHEHANSASEYYSRGLLIPAAEEYYKAAEAFQTCANQSTDEHTKGTLRKLCTHYYSVGKDLQRRIAKLREEGKDPSLPQVSHSPRGAAKSNDNETSSNPGSGLHVPPRARSLESSATTFDESFMVLNQQSDNNGEDSPFDLFWKVTGEIMYNLSQPMSFQTAAMAALDAVESRTASTQSESGNNEAVNTSIPSVRRTNGMPNKDHQKRAESAKSVQLSKTDEFELDDDDYDSLDDFCFIPSTSSSDLSSSTKLKKENAELKLKLENMEKQMGAVRRQITLRNEQDQHLRDNIMLARKEAQRAMAASTSFAVPSMHSMANLGSPSPGSNLNLPQPAGAGGRDRDAPLLRRIRELEEELRVVRVENEKQKAMIAKFRERWEKLKESAKRKKSAKANAAGQTDSSVSAGVRERIDEDPEGEAAAAEDSGKEKN
ncbi:uncharacterized protein FOMMEDRAFT_18216 [Fomitiporia mediterranea MF3/22]|uniref:uncharacterized protein n=1 Tax=Fomitiporia mediterranea (strain MF3/22) TaxID=694068 RepID=UPI0004407EBE|nr:uncharacterized protein FOMMEDRAFT_18216 [Fomitiporia mediterranea MF3/22]EJD05997.1 hypothetical protein FOMMEDRAFT_18216 [Fomitiporia mediterranea MF3/22]